MVNRDEMLLRSKALDIARQHVIKITENFEPLPYEIIQHGGGPLTPSPRTTMTPGDQVLNQLLDIGSWLLGEARP
jgi:hypothetical protein